ncbi:MAG TPA: dihydropteroate synthase [Chloroflexota bacterium]|nr:dihydropteroate synthase [Chloroflexota bacterium]
MSRHADQDLMGAAPARHLPETAWGRRRIEWGARTYIMGIINMTDDSFSGDGLGMAAEDAVAQARRFVDEGADILDIGGESTRPGYAAVDAAEETRRVVPAIAAIAAAVSAPLSVDTRKLEVARAALDAGACIINNVDAILDGGEMFQLAAERRVPVVIMHNKGAAVYDDLIAEVLAALSDACRAATFAGVPAAHQIVDPGIGFGKTGAHNLLLLRRLGELRALDRPVLVGPSRKRFLGALLGTEANDRLEGTAAAVALAIAGGADLVRVHDVHAMARVARVADAICRGRT